MSKHRATRSTQSTRPTRPTGLRRQAFPAFAAFVRGYLHEDFAEVHGSVSAAAAAFCADANPVERQALAQELSKLVTITADRPLSEFQRFVQRELGGAWNPDSQTELEDLVKLVSSPA